MPAARMPVSLRQAIAAGCGLADAVLADLDGCLVADGHLRDGAADLFAQADGRLWIVSNNSTDTAASLSARLTARGLPLPPERSLLAGEQTPCAIWPGLRTRRAWSCLRHP